MIRLDRNGSTLNVCGETPSAGTSVHLSQFKITHSRTGRELRFVETVAEHQPTILANDRIEFYDTGSPTDSGATVRRFFGYADKPKPKGAQVEYICHDPLAKLHEVMIADVDGLPRLLLNVPFDHFDFPDSIACAYTYRQDANGPMPYRVTDAWRQLLELHDTAIHDVCPGLPGGFPWTQRTLNPELGGIADHYLPDAGHPGDPAFNLLHEDLKFEPQRLIWEQQTLGAAVDSLNAMAPAWEFHFDPETLLFRWLLRASVTGSNLAAMTRWLNKIADPSVGYSRPILTKQIEPSIRDRWTRVEILGPRKQVPRIAYKSSGTNGTITVGGQVIEQAYSALAEDWTAGEETGWSILLARANENPSATIARWRVFRQYKLVVGVGEERKKRILRWIRDGMWRPGIPGLPDSSSLTPGRPTQFYSVNILRTHRPVLLAKFQISGQNAWFSVGCQVDYINGVVVADHPLVLGDIRIAGSTFTKPVDVALAYAYPDPPVLASYPVADDTFEGTAYSVHAIARKCRFYDEQNYNDNTKVNYQKLAKALWRTRGDIVYSGPVVFHGIDYSFEGFNSARNENKGLLNLAGLNDDGTTATTGWEAINAPVHEIEYDYEERTTTITVNSDWAEYVFGDYESLKIRLQEAAREQRLIWIPGALITQGTTPGRPTEIVPFINLKPTNADPMQPGF